MIFLMFLSSRRAVVRLDGAPVHEDVEDAELSQVIFTDSLRMASAKRSLAGSVADGADGAAI
jgi:hypothetical protein